MPKLTIQVSQQEADEFARTGELVVKKEREEEWPKNGDDYYYNELDWTTWCSSWASDNTDHRRYAAGNVFRTREEAKKYNYYLKAIATVTRAIKKLNGDWKADWSNREQRKYSLYYDNCNNQWSCDYWSVSEALMPFPFCKSEEVAKQIIKDHGPDLKIIRDYHS